MSLQSHIANELQNSAALSAAHARELMKMATGRVAEINARYQAIATARGFRGLVRCDAQHLNPATYRQLSSWTTKLNCWMRSGRF